LSYARLFICETQ